MGMQIHGIYRQDVYELPTDSVRELIANAVAHRSYRVQEKMVTGKFYKFASQKRMDKPSRMRYIIYRQENILCFR